jgi:hypothetical protein
MWTLEAPGPECGPVIGLPHELGVSQVAGSVPYAIAFIEQDPGKDRTIQRRSGSPRNLDDEGAGMTWAPA